MTDAFAPARDARLEKYRLRALEVADRISRGESWSEVAADYGIVDVKSFRRRVKAHVGEIDKRDMLLRLLDDVESVLAESHDALWIRLGEIRRRYE